MRISVGLETTDTKRNKISLSQLRRTTRSKKDKTSGRKKPRTKDYDDIPAPDSIENVSNNLSVCNQHICSQYIDYHNDYINSPLIK